MNKLIIFPIILTAFILLSCEKTIENSSNPQNQSKLTILPDGSQTVTGNISVGENLNDLSWAWNSSMACFVEPAKESYEGSHVFYQFNLPKHSTLDIYLTPNNSSDNLALYGFSKGASSTETPPTVTSSISCEADPSTSNGAGGRERHIYLNATTNPYSVIIGIAGSKGLNTAGYSLKIDLKN